MKEKKDREKIVGERRERKGDGSRRAAAIATGSNPTEYPPYANRGVVIVSIKRNPNVIPFLFQVFVV